MTNGLWEDLEFAQGRKNELFSSPDISWVKRTITAKVLVFDVS